MNPGWALAFGLSVAGSALAQSGVSPGNSPETLLLDICVDDTCDGIAVVLATQAQTLIERAALQGAGVTVPADAAVRRIGERDFIDASQLGPGIRATIDRATLRLDIRRAASALPSQSADFHAPPPDISGRRDWSASLNYSANLGTRRDARSLYLEGRAGRGPWLLRSDAQWLVDQGLRRGLTRFEYDQTTALRRWTVGDQYVLSPDPLGGSALLGGLGVQRAFDLDPFLITFPQPYLDGVLQAPGVVEVYANGALVGRQALQAGPFSLQGLGLSPGRNDVKLIVRDPFGGTRELSSATYYSASGLLAQGLSEYALRLGRARPSPYEDRYLDDTVLAGFWRHGLTRSLTVGGRIEADRDLRNAGAQAVFRLPLGELSASLARSQGSAAGEDGNAMALDYRYSNRVGGWSLGARRFDRGYRRLGQTVLDSIDGGQLPRDDVFLATGWTIGSRLSLQLHWNRNRYYDALDRTRYGLDGTWHAGADAQVYFSLSHTEDANGHDTIALLGVSLALGRDNLNVGVRHDRAGWGVGLDANRSRPPGTGFGYSASYDRRNGDDYAYARGEYQGRYGRYALSVQDNAGRDEANLQFSGALVAIGGRAFATPPVENGFALVRVPGVAGVTVRRENLPVGSTDRAGDLLVRDLLPYYPNRLGYDDADLPADWSTGPNAMTVAAPRFGGTVVSFEAHPLRAITGSARLPAALADPRQAATMRLSGGGHDYATRISGSGRYYLEDVAGGRYDVDIDFDNGARARCALMVPDARQGVTRLETITCREVSR